MRKSDRTFILGLLALGATLYLMSQPRCSPGCKTVLEHLLTHELSILL